MVTVSIRDGKEATGQPEASRRGNKKKELRMRSSQERTKSGEREERQY